MREGAFFGWPWYYLGAHEDPRRRGERPDLKDKITVPDVLIQAHSASMRIAFYNASQFPAEYQGDGFARTVTKKAPIKAPEPPQQGDAGAEKPVVDAIEQPVLGATAS